MRQFVNWIKLICFSCVEVLITKNCRISENSVMIIRLDAIGDYVLFRNFLKELRNSKRYKGSNITLVGNLAWKSLAMELDAGVLDEFIWIDRKKFAKNLRYRYRKLKQITSSGYETVISPVISREFFYADWLVKAVYARDKIGSVGDYSNITSQQKKISDTWFTELIPVQEGVLFEFYRNKEFFEHLLNKRIIISKPCLKLEFKRLSVELPENYAILFIGASARFRQWDIEKFAEVANYLKCELGLDIVLCGGGADKINIPLFNEYYTDYYYDLVGKTSLVDFLNIVSHAQLMLTNETFAPHFGVALEMKNLFVISNGNHFGRFTPYPKEITDNYHVTFHPKIEYALKDYNECCDLYGYGSNLDISEISAESVIKRIGLTANSGL